MKKLLKYGVWGLLTLGYSLAYTGNLSHIIAYHEQHHLFLFSKAYFEQQILSEGLLSYLTDFLIQFFYYPTGGSILLAVIIASIYLLTRNLIRLVFGKEDWLHLSVIPSLLLFYYTMTVNHSLTVVTGTFLGLTAANLLLGIFHRFMPLLPIPEIIPIRKKNVRIAMVSIAILAYGCFGYYYYVKNYNRNEGITLKAAMYVKAKDWKNVLKYTELYLSGGQHNQIIYYFHHLALYHTGKLPYRLFDYPQLMGAQSLYFHWNNNVQECEYGHYLYEDLGLINEAQHWEFEAMVVWGETAPHLLNLARYNIVNKRPKVAQRFINKLKKSLFYKEQALQLEAILHTGKIEQLKNGLANEPLSPARFTNTQLMAQELKYLCDSDEQNQMAFEYLMSIYLLNNNVTDFVNNLHRIHRFNYPSLPQAYEEALLIYKYKAGEEALKETGFTISPETESRFERYNQLMRDQQIKSLQREFGNSYWFYQNFISSQMSKAFSLPN